MFKKAVLTLSLLGIVCSANASDKQLREKLEDAVKVLQSRTAEVDSDKAKANAVVKATNEIVKAAQDDYLKFDALTLQSRAYYALGELAESKDEKLEIYDAGIKACDMGIQLDADNDDLYAECYYMRAINLARWAETKGILASLNRKKELLGNLEEATLRETRDGRLGEEYDGYGPHRVYGRMFFKLPVVAGGSKKKSKEHLSKAYKNAPKVILNGVYYAETLSTGNKDDKTLACKVLDEVLAINPKVDTPTYVAENVQSQKLARELKNSECN